VEEGGGGDTVHEKCFGHTKLLSPLLESNIFKIKPKTLLFLLRRVSCGLGGWGGGIGNKTNPGCFSLSTPSLCNFTSIC
jgi:hypothetical protein